MNPWRRRLLWMLPVAGVLLALAIPFLRPAAIPVEVAAVARGPLEETVEEDGQTRVHPRYVVAAPVAGRLAALRVDPGTVVEPGDVVATLTPAPLDPRAREQAEAGLRAERAHKAAADAAVAESAATLAQNQRTLARTEQLAAAGQLAAEDLERARTAVVAQEKVLEAARFRARAATYTVKNAQAALLGDADAGAVIALASPVSGRVLRLVEDSERVIPAGSPILELGDLSTLEIVIDVLTTDAVNVPVGAAIRVDTGAGRPLSARVTRVEPAAFLKVSPLGVEEQRVNVIGNLLEPAPGVGDRFRVRATIVLWHSADALQVSSGALFRAGDHWAVMLADGDRAHRTAVEIGHRGATAVEVLGGLRPGDRVVLYPDSGLADGARIALISPTGEH